MDIIRIQFETNRYEYRRVRRTYDESVRHFRVGGKPPYKGVVPSTYYSAKSRSEPEIKYISNVRAEYYQQDNSHMFNSYDDAIELGYSFSPPVDYLDIQTGFSGFTPDSIFDFHRDIEDIFINDLTERRKNEHYQGAYWGIRYTLFTDDSANSSYRHTELYAFGDTPKELIKDQLVGIFNDMIEAFEGYKNIVVHNIFIKLRNDDLEL